jgi:hypothetical protein
MMRGSARGPRTRTWIGGLAVVAAAGCYTYRPLGSAMPAPGAEISLVLTDQGRVAAGGVLGPSVDRVEGPLVDANDSAYLVRVMRVTDIRGTQSRWSAEAVAVNRAWVATAYSRQFSRSRTYVIAGAFTAALTAFVATRTLGQHGPVLQAPGGTGGGNGQ